MNASTRAEREAGPEEFSLPQQRYIESIAELTERKGRARTSDLAGQLGVKMPSVSEAVGRLVRLGLAVRQSRHGIVLTEEGQTISEKLQRRQSALSRFMVNVLGLDRATADEMACRLEHCVDPEFSNRLLKLAEFLEQEPAATLRRLERHLETKEAAGGDARAGVAKTMGKRRRATVA